MALRRSRIRIRQANTSAMPSATLRRMVLIRVTAMSAVSSQIDTVTSRGAVNPASHSRT